MKTTPRRYQIKGVRKVRKLKYRALIADDMGLGKSLQALMAAKELDAKPVLVVCPAPLKINWQRECYKHFGIRAEILEGTKAPRKGFRRFAPITIVNYEILKFWRKYIDFMGVELLILDEAHYLKNPEAKRTILTKQISEGVPCVLALTGTPIVNIPAELWPILNIVQPNLFPSKMRFYRRYCNPQLKPWGWEFKGATNVEELHKILNAKVMLRRKKEDVLSQLPPQTISVVPLPLERRREYNKALNEFVNWVALNYGKGRARKAAKAERLVQMGYLKRLAAELKLKYVFDWIDNYFNETEDKLAVFAIHKSIIKQIHQRYYRTSVVVDGSVTGRKRMQAVDQFNDNRKTRLFIGEYRAAGAGFSLAAPAAACVEIAWNPATHAQAMARIHGLGRGVEGKVSSAYFLVGVDTIEEKLCALNQDKAETFNALIDGREDSSFNLFDRLTQELVKGR